MAGRSGPVSDNRLSPLATLVGDDQDNVIFGTPEDDEIRGLGGNDDLFGLLGRDELYGGAGRDELYGNASSDLLLGRMGDDRLVGGRGDDTLEGEEGDDRLLGNQGADFLRGGSGNDVLRGNRGPDALLGRSGDDILDGGLGPDVLEGGPNTDRFVFTQLDGQLDRITDIEDKDLLDLSALVPIATTNDDLADFVRQTDLPGGNLIEVRPEGALDFTPLVLIEGTAVADFDAARLGLDDIPADITTAQVLSGTESDSAASRIQEPGDVDWFRILLQPARDYAFDLAGTVAANGKVMPGALRDPVLELRTAAGGLVASDDNGGPGLAAHIDVASDSLAPGFYFLAASGAGGLTGDYVLNGTVQAPPPALPLSSAEPGPTTGAEPRPAGGRALALEEVLSTGPAGPAGSEQAAPAATVAATDPGPLLPSVSVEDPSTAAA